MKNQVDIVALAGGIIVILFGMGLWESGWHYTYAKPVPKITGLMVVIYGAYMFAREVAKLIRK